MGLQWAHPELVGQGHGLTVGDCGFFDIRGMAMRSDLTEESETPRLVPSFIAHCRAGPHIAGGER